METNLDAEEVSLSSVTPIVDEEPTLIDKIVLASQKGDIDSLTDLIEEAKNTYNDGFSTICDKEGVTPIHWAALNNRVAAIDFLIDSQFDADLKGGSLQATPILWAARYGLIYVVDRLIKKGKANVNTLDSTGVGILHAAVFSSNVLMVIYILYMLDGLEIDFQDLNGRSALHWAAYQGDFLTVEALLKAGAKVDLQDDQGFTALHWAMVNGSTRSVQLLVNAGSDIKATTSDGKTCWTVASDMKFTNQWNEILQLCHRNTSTGEKVRFLCSEKFAKLGTFIMPHLTLPLSIELIVGSFHWYIKLPLLLSTLLIQLLILKRLFFPVILKHKKSVLKTPLFAGVFSATFAWCILIHIFALIPYTFREKFLCHILLWITAAITYFAFFKTMHTNPGFIPEEDNNVKIRETIDELINLMKFDDSNFCIHTMIRKPIRCRYSDEKRLNIARFDHYCPWTFNYIGVRNHKLFFVFSMFLFLSIILWADITVKYFAKLRMQSGEDSNYGFFDSPFIFGLLIWVLFQLAWLTILLLVQAFQISIGATTYEYAKISKRSHSASSSLVREDQVTDRSERSGGCLSALLSTKAAKMVGLDQFLLLSNDVMRSHSTGSSPYNYGFRQNWVDFLFLRKNGDACNFRTLIALPLEGEGNLNYNFVDYYKLYSPPESV